MQQLAGRLNGSNLQQVLINAPPGDTDVASIDKAGLDVPIEPINTRDIPRFFLNHQDHPHEIIALVSAPNLKVKMDQCQCQIVEGDTAMRIRKYLPMGHTGDTSAGLGWAGLAAQRAKDPMLDKSLSSYTLASRIGVTMFNCYFSAAHDSA